MKFVMKNCVIGFLESMLILIPVSFLSSAFLFNNPDIPFGGVLREMGAGVIVILLTIIITVTINLRRALKFAKNIKAPVTKKELLFGVGLFLVLLIGVCVLIVKVLVPMFTGAFWLLLLLPILSAIGSVQILIVHVI